MKEELEKNNSSIKVEIHPGEDNDHNNFYLRNDIIEPIKQFINKYNLKSNDIIIDIKDEQISKFYKMPTSLSKKIESIFFKIEDFKLFKDIKVKNATFLMKLIDNRIAVVNGASILIYNQKNYSPDEKIELKEKVQMIEITSLFQMKNENLVCGTNTGNIILYKYDNISEMYIEIKAIKNQIQNEIYKIEQFCEGLIYVLSKDGITIYDDIDINKKNYIHLNFLYFDFVHISGNKIAMLKENYLSILAIDQKEFIKHSEKIETIYEKNVLIVTNKYLILGGREYIYIGSFSKYNTKKRKTLIWEYKIHSKNS